MTAKPQDRPTDLAAPAAALDDLQQSLGEIRSAIERQENAATRHFDELQNTLAGLTEQLDGLAERLLGISPSPGLTRPEFPRTESRSPELPRPEPVAERHTIEQPAVPSTSESPTGDWDSVLLGDELASQDDLEIDRQELLGDVRNGDPAACALLGQLLVFRAANSDRLPVLLKDIGEAYYRWRPAASIDDAFRDSLITWLQQTCAAAGLANTIELVHPGDRYDSTRHNTRERGVEVAEVFGWVVLRDNGSVYTKASVAVK